MSWFDPPPVVQKPIVTSTLRLPSGMRPRDAQKRIYGGAALGAVFGGVAGIVIDVGCGRVIPLSAFAYSVILTICMMLGAFLAHAAAIRSILRALEKEFTSS